MIGVLVALAMALPVRLVRLPSSIADWLAKDYGVTLTIEEGRLWLLPPRAELRGAALSKVGASPAWQAEKVELSFNPLSWLVGGGKFLRSIAIDGPSPLSFRYDGATVVPEGKTRELVSLARRGESSSATLQLPAWSVELRDLRLVIRRGADPAIALPARGRKSSWETTAVAVTLQALHLWETSSHRVGVVAQGEIAISEAPAAFELEGAFFGEGEFSGSLRSPSIRGRWPLGFRGDVSAEAREARVDLRFLRQGDSLECMVDASAADLALAIPHRHITYRDENVQGSLRARLRWDEHELEIDQLRVTSPVIGLEAAGKATLDRASRFEAVVDAQYVGGPYIELLNAALPRGFDVSARQGRLSANLRLAGQDSLVTSLIGKLTFSTVTLHTPHFRSPVDDLQGELDFEPQRMVWHNVGGRLGGTHLKVDGELTGDYLTSRTGIVRLHWESRATAGELADLLQAAAGDAAVWRDPPTSVRGVVEGEGELEQIITEDPSSWPPPRMGGTLAVRGVGFAHRSLRAPVANVEGVLKVEDARLAIERLSGSWGPTRVLVEGVVQGKNYFWRDAALSATVQLAGRAEDLPQILPSDVAVAAASVRPRGGFELALRAETPLGNWRSSKISGRMWLRDAAFDIQTESVEAALRETNAELQWDGRQLRISAAQASLNDVALVLSGVVDALDIRCDLSAQGELENVQRLWRRMGAYVEMHGPARCRASVRFPEPAAPQEGGRARPTSLEQLLVSLPQRIARAWDNARIESSGEIVVGSPAQGAVFRHHAMPPARTLPYGLTVPRAEIKDIRGTLKLANNALEVPGSSPLACSMADTPNCRLSGRIVAVAQQFPRIEFRVETTSEARMDTWLTGWGTAFTPPPPQKASATPRSKRFEIAGKIIAARATYKDQHVEDSSAELVYTFVRGQPPRRTEFRNVSIRGFGGTMKGEGFIESWREDPENFPRWQARVEIDHARIPPLSHWVFQQPQTVEGWLSARMQLEGVRNDIHRLRGEGRATLIEVEAGRLPFILKLFQMVNLTQTRGFFEKAPFNSRPDTEFRIADGVLECERMELETEGLLLEWRGKYYLDSHALDASVRLNLFESSLLGALPIVSDIARVADRTLGKFIVAFRVTGPASHPVITPLPLPLFQNANR